MHVIRISVYGRNHEFDAGVDQHQRIVCPVLRLGISGFDGCGITRLEGSLLFIFERGTVFNKGFYHIQRAVTAGNAQRSCGEFKLFAALHDGFRLLRIALKNDLFQKLHLFKGLKCTHVIGNDKRHIRFHFRKEFLNLFKLLLVRKALQVFHMLPDIRLVACRIGRIIFVMTEAETQRKPAADRFVGNIIYGQLIVKQRRTAAAENKCFFIKLLRMRVKGRRNVERINRSFVDAPDAAVQRDLCPGRQAIHGPALQGIGRDIFHLRRNGVFFSLLRRYMHEGLAAVAEKRAVFRRIYGMAFLHTDHAAHAAKSAVVDFGYRLGNENAGEVFAIGKDTVLDARYTLRNLKLLKLCPCKSALSDFGYSGRDADAFQRAAAAEKLIGDFGDIFRNRQGFEGLAIVKSLPPDFRYAVRNLNGF